MEDVMKKIIYKLYYTLRFGGWRYVWLRVAGKPWKSQRATQFLYRKTKETPPEKYKEQLIRIYGLRTGKKLNLENPQTFNEKIQWLKLYDANTELKTRLTDKRLAREWVAEKIGSQYLIPLLGVWDKFEEVEPDKLPGKFVLKTNHGSGCNVAVTDKEKVDWAEVKQKFDAWMSINFAFMGGFEMQYLNIRPCILAEQYIENENGNLYDYKIHCFNGKPEYIQVIGDRDLKTHKAREAFYNTQWVLQPFTYTYPRYDKGKKKPEKLQEMLRIAAALSRGFLYVRVDLYELEHGKVKFGEMTFTPASGMDCWNPPAADWMLGAKINITGKRMDI